MDAYIKELCQDYLDYIAQAQNPSLDADDRRYISAQRTLTHEALIAILGPSYDRPFDMQAYARSVIASAH